MLCFDVQGDKGWVLQLGHQIDRLGVWFISIPNLRTANVLAEACEVQRGDRVIVILPRLPEWWLINIACLRTGNRIETNQLSSL